MIAMSVIGYVIALGMLMALLVTAPGAPLEAERLDLGTRASTPLPQHRNDVAQVQHKLGHRS